jgi:hypothetical protein
MQARANLCGTRPSRADSVRSSVTQDQRPWRTTHPAGGRTSPDQRRTRDRLEEPTVPTLVPAGRPSAMHGPGLPVARLTAARRSSSVCYALTKIDDRGRLADRSLIRVLRWEPGRLVQLTVVPEGAVLVASGAGGRHWINGQGHLRLPASVQRSCGLEPGDQVLLAAYCDREVVVAYTMAAVDAMVRIWHASHAAEANR